MTTRALLFVHGAFHGPWCWDGIVARMQSPELACRCVDLSDDSPRNLQLSFTQHGLRNICLGASISLCPGPPYRRYR